MCRINRLACVALTDWHVSHVTCIDIADIGATCHSDKNDMYVGAVCRVPCALFIERRYQHRAVCHP